MLLLLLSLQASTAEPAKQANAKPKQVCEYIAVTGSRGKKRVCKDESGHLDLGPGIRSVTINPDEETEQKKSKGE